MWERRCKGHWERKGPGRGKRRRGQRRGPVGSPRRLALLHCADTYGSLPLGWDWALTLDIPDPLMRAPSHEEGLSSHAPQSKPEPLPPCADATTGLVNLRRKSRMRRRCPRGTRRACPKIWARYPLKSVVSIPRTEYRGGHQEVPPSPMAEHPSIDVDTTTNSKNEGGKTEPPHGLPRRSHGLPRRISGKTPLYLKRPRGPDRSRVMFPAWKRRAPPRHWQAIDRNAKSVFFNCIYEPPLNNGNSPTFPRTAVGRRVRC